MASTTGFDRQAPVSLWVVDFGDTEVASSNLELQCEVISQAVEPIANIAPSATKVDLRNVPDPRNLQKTLMLDNANELPNEVCGGRV